MTLRVSGMHRCDAGRGTAGSLGDVRVSRAIPAPAYASEMDAEEDGAGPSVVVQLVIESAGPS